MQHLWMRFKSKSLKVRFRDKIASLTLHSSLACLSIIAYISQTFPAFTDYASNQFIRKAYSASILHPTSRDVATTLSLLALSLSSGSQLMPGLDFTGIKNTPNHLKDAVREFGSVAVFDPNIEAFIVVKIASEQLTMSLAAMIKAMKGLVGELDLGVNEHTADVIPMSSVGGVDV
jgi:hypothetical protein